MSIPRENTRTSPSVSADCLTGLCPQVGPQVGLPAAPTPGPTGIGVQNPGLSWTTSDTSATSTANPASEGSGSGIGDSSMAPPNVGSLAAPTSLAVVSSPSAASLGVSSTSKANSLSGGAVAGVAIAALLIGAAIAFAAAFFLFKRRNNKARDGTVGYNNYADSTPELVMMQQKSAGRNSPYVQVSQTPLPAPIPAAAALPLPVQQPDVLASILPAAAHENEVQGRVAALFNQIHRHVETYYRDVHASITPSMEPELIRFGAKDVNMAELLQDCSIPTTALKHALVTYTLGITSPKKGDGSETLFPEELNGAGSRAQNGAGSALKLSTAHTLHRRLSVLLYNASNPTSISRRSWSFQSDIREAAEHFSLTFFPWANPSSDDQEKEDDLTRVISEALETRVWLYGQPSEFDFRWDGVGTRGIVVSPELVRVDEGDRSGRGRVVLESGVAGL